MTVDELRQRLGPHHAPAGLYARHQALPFAGRLHCDVRAVEAGSWQEIVIDYEVGASGVADGAWFKLTFKFYSDWAATANGAFGCAGAARASATATAGRPGAARCGCWAAGALRREIGGTEFFVALERLTDAPLPREVSGRFEVDAVNAGFGHRPVYVEGRQRDDAKVWASALFIDFVGG